MYNQHVQAPLPAKHRNMFNFVGLALPGFFILRSDGEVKEDVQSRLCVFPGSMVADWYVICFKI